jgi:hypothetical protein
MSNNAIESIHDVIILNKTKGIPEGDTLKKIMKMIENGADINLQQDGTSTAVMSAAASGYLSIVEYLIKSGADLSLKNRWKEDIKLCAKLGGNKEVIKLVNSKLKNIKNTEPFTIKFFKPKKGTQAEYTFIPSKEFKRTHKSKHSDVGYYLDDEQILVFATNNQSDGKFRGNSFTVDEGSIEINIEEWDELSEKVANNLIKREKCYMYEMRHIIEEYLNE